MSTLAMAILAAEAVVFAVWIVLAFDFLFALRRDAVQASGSVLPGLGATLAAFRGGLVEVRYRPRRRRLLLVTIAMFALIAALPALVA